jgi:hypothetical protein
VNTMQNHVRCSGVAHLPKALTYMGLILSLSSTALSAHESHGKRLKIDMVPSAVALSCLPMATAHVTVKPEGPVERMTVKVSGLPPKTNFDFFVIQVPEKPFGLSWYQGDIETDDDGNGYGQFVGRFNIETFIVAPGSDVAPKVHEHPPEEGTTDAESNNPQPGPVHTYHLGLWFNSPVDSNNAGCGNTITPFNGEHNAGPQVLNTSNYPKEAGPLINLEP